MSRLGRPRVSWYTPRPQLLHARIMCGKRTLYYTLPPRYIHTRLLSSSCSAITVQLYTSFFFFLSFFFPYSSPISGTNSFFVLIWIFTSILIEKNNDACDTLVWYESWKKNKFFLIWTRGLFFVFWGRGINRDCNVGFNYATVAIKTFCFHRWNTYAVYWMYCEQKYH